jgi:hypothetical protein
LHLSYAAGLIDGEGYVGIQEAGGSMQVRLKVAMTDKGLPSLRAMHKTFGGHLSQDRPEGLRRRSSHVWRLNGRKATDLLDRLLPMLLVKAEPARIALEFQAMIDAAPKRTNRQAVWTEDMHRRARIFRARIQDANRTGPDAPPPALPDARPLAVRRWGEWWEPDETLFGPVEFVDRFPTWGRMVAGHIYPLPTSAPPTAGRGCSSSPGLPTPTARDWKAPGPADHRREGSAALSAIPALLGTPRVSSGNGVGQYEENPRGMRGRLEAQVDALLKTPTAQLAVNGGSQHPAKRAAGGHGPTLADEVEHLMPTPTATDSKGSRGHRRDGTTYGPTSGVTLTDATETLLPTPRATDGTKGGPNQRGSSGDLMLPSAVQLLPTPSATDGTGGQSLTVERRRERGHQVGLPNVAQTLATGGDRTAAPSDDGRLF